MSEVGVALSNGVVRLKSKISECCYQQDSCHTSEAQLGEWLPTIIPEFASWLSNQTKSLCLAETPTCPECSIYAANIVKKINEDDFQLHQTSFMIDSLCEDGETFTDCLEFVTSTWPVLERCVTGEDWILSDLTCLYYGGCLGSSKDWTCSEVNRY